MSPSRDENRALTTQHRVTAADLAVVALSVMIGAYVTARAATVSITIDEAVTWFLHVNGGTFDILLLRTPGEPDNNHVLFTLLAKLSVAMFGLSELALRLPSLLGFVGFMIGANLVLRRIVPGWRQALGVAALGLNPYLIDYFSVARGYGLALGFTSLGMAALLASISGRPEDPRLRSGQAAVLLFALAALANLSFLLILLAGILVLSLLQFFQRNRPSVSAEQIRSPCRTALAIALPSMPILAYLLYPLIVLGRRNLFSFGGTTGFWHDTVGSLIDGTIHEVPWFVDSRWLLQIWVAATLLLTAPVLWTLWKLDRRGFIAFAAICGMTLLVATASLVQHELLNVALLDGRHALAFIPLFILWAIASTMARPAAPRTLTAATYFVGAVVPALLCLNGLLAMNVSYVRDWRFDAGARDIMTAAKSWIDWRRPEAVVRMRSSWILAPSGNFYRATLDLESRLLPLTMEDGPEFSTPADLYYVQGADQAAVAKFGVKPLAWSPVADTMLLEQLKDSASWK